MTEALAPPLQELQALARSLRDAGLAASVDDVRDILWLADVRGPALAAAAARVAGPVAPGTDRQQLDTEAPRADAPGADSSGVSTRDPSALYANAQRGHIAAGMLRVPGVAVMPAPAELRRALQPLARRVPSATRWQLDEEATATHRADTGAWRLCLQPLRERWFDLNVIVEQSPSMRLWRPEVESFVRALKGQGGFRSLQRFVLAPGPDLLHTPDGRRALPLAALQPAGRRPLTLLLTDTGSALWRSGAAQRFLFAAGALTSISVLQLLPPRAWRHTALGEPAVVAVAPHPGSPAARLQPVAGGDDIDADDAHDTGRCLVPLLALDPASIRRWALAMAARVAASVPCAAVARDAEPLTSPMPAPAAADAVAAFRRKVSQAAYDLAVFLTVPDPLTLPVMRLVQRTMLPDTGTGELAEFMLGGLLVEAGEDAGAGGTVYRFRDGVRDALMQGLRYSEEDRVAQQLARVGRTLEQAQAAGPGDDFSAYFPQPGGGARLSEWALPFATLSRGILQALEPPVPDAQEEEEEEEEQQDEEKEAEGQAATETEAAPVQGGEASEAPTADTKAGRRDLVVRVKGGDGTWTTGYRITREHVVTAYRAEGNWRLGDWFEVQLSIGTFRHVRKARPVGVDPQGGTVVLELEEPLDPGPVPPAEAPNVEPGSALQGLVLFDTDEAGAPAPGVWFEGVVEAVQPDFIVRCPQLEESPPHEPGLPGSPLWSDGQLVGHLVAPGPATGTWRACPIGAVFDLSPRQVVHPRAVSAPAAYVSVAQSDHSRLQAWTDALRDAGLTLLPEPSSTAASDNWSSRMLNGLKQASCAVVAISQAWHASKWCQYEARTLADRARSEPGFRIVPLRLDDAEVPAEFQPLLAVDLRRSTQPDRALIHALVTGLRPAKPPETPRPAAEPPSETASSSSEQEVPPQVPEPEAWFADHDPQLMAIGSLIAEFRSGLDGATRRAVAESLLLAQLAADRAAENEDEKTSIAGWYRRYTDVLTNTGWLAQTMEFTHREIPAGPGGLREAVLPVLTALLGPSLASASLLLPLLDRLGQWQQEPAGITLFHRASEHQRGAKFQLALIDADASGNPAMQVLCIGIEAERTITAVLFFQAKDERARIEHATGHFTIGRSLLASTREAVAQRVAPRVPAMVRNLAL